MVLVLDRPTRIGYLSLGDELPELAEKILHPSRFALGQNPLLDPDTCDEVLTSLHESRSLDNSFGGWLEKRHKLWAKGYPDQRKTTIHLAVDVNAKAGTKICVDRHAEVVLVESDYPEETDGGWGTSVTVKLLREREPIYLRYAHLAPKVWVSKWNCLRPGQLIGEIGRAPQNGNWYQHVHVQALTEEAWKLFLENPSSLDGYGSENDIERLARLYPDPIRWLDL